MEDIIVYAIILLIGGAWLWALVLNIMEGRRMKRFCRFIAENAEVLLNDGSCEFEGDLYTRETKLVRFQFCVSVIVLTLTRGTSFHPTEDRNSLLLSCVLISLFGGWWGIPWGPINTIRSFIENGKAEEITVQQLILTMAAQQG